MTLIIWVGGFNRWVELSAKMGQGGSSEFKETFQSTVSQLSQVQLAEIGAR